MSAEKLREWINSLTDDIEFQYQNIHGAICPFTRENISISYGGAEKTVHSIDAAMNEPFFNGKSLNQIADELEIDSF